MTQPIQTPDMPLMERAHCAARKCRRPAEKRNLCGRCYQRWYKATARADRPPITTLERFWEKVDTNGPIPAHAPHLGKCWIWTGAARDSGHGSFYVSEERGVESANTFAIELATGRPCPPSMEGCHRCDNPPCVRPSHSYYGTRRENVEDAWARDRQPVGSERHGAKLNEFIAEEIRIRCAAGERQKDLAAEFGVLPCTISQIVNGLRWRHAGGPIPRKES